MGKTHSPRFLASVDAARALIEECDSAQLRAMMDDGDQLIVVDVREAHEYAAGHLEGAVHIGKGVLERDIEKQDWDDDARIVLYCGGGFRSSLAAKSVQEMGWTNVLSLWGGWRGIQAEGLPLWQP